MAANECKIDVRLALALRDLIDAAGVRSRNLFRCIECGSPVSPQGGQNQRFEHLERSPGCQSGAYRNG